MTTTIDTRPTDPELRAGVVEHAADRLARLARDHDGIAFLRDIASGELPAPPIAELVGFDITEIEPGRVMVAMRPRLEHYNPIGSVHGGIAATLLDTAIGCAVHCRLPRGTGYTTLDLQVRYLKPVSVRTGIVLATGTVVHLGRRTATAEGRLVQADTGSLLATATSSLLVLS
ncbi:MAG TPA: PaaI family thioesterase [Mycobacteriales bacterium]|nr:PaaI family thioesterase [Mycobacteriales bacterium]